VGSIVGDLTYVRPKGHDEFKIQAPPLAIERLIRTKLEGRIVGSTSHGELLRLFRHFDRDGSGQIDLQEFKKMMSAFNIKLTDDAAKRMFEQYDRSGDGTISYDEFKAQVMQESHLKKHRVATTDSGPQDVDYMLKGGGRGLELTNIDWSSGKVESNPLLIERVLRQKLVERTGQASKHELRRAWNLIDKDSMKRLGLEDINMFLKLFNISLTRQKLKDLFARYDVNGEGLIDLASFEGGVLHGRFPKKGHVNIPSYEDENIDTRPDTTRGRVSRALRNGGITGVDLSGHVSVKTKPEEIERTLRVKLRERSDGRSCHELHRIWMQYDKDFDHRVDINEFKQILVAFNIHPADAMLRSLFKRYDSNSDGLIERAEFENAILNGIIPNSGQNKVRAATSLGLNSSRHQNLDENLFHERSKLESHARDTLEMLQAAKAANSRVLNLQGARNTLRTARNILSSRPGTVPNLMASMGGLQGTGMGGRSPHFSLDLSKTKGL